MLSVLPAAHSVCFGSFFCRRRLLGHPRVAWEANLPNSAPRMNFMEMFVGFWWASEVWGGGMVLSWSLGFPWVLLLQKDSCDNREWIQAVHELHGSVERSSISQARSINGNGVFIISAPPKFKVDVLQDLVSCPIGGLMLLGEKIFLELSSIGAWQVARRSPVGLAAGATNLLLSLGHFQLPVGFCFLQRKPQQCPKVQHFDSNRCRRAMW